MSLKNLGLAYRANQIILGTDKIVEALRKNEIHLVLLANDASLNTKKKISDKTKTYQVNLIDKYSTNELSDSIGRRNVKVIGVKDKGFSMLLT